MRFLGIGRYHQLGAMYLALKEAGHDVKVHVEEPKARDILKGSVKQVSDWRQELPWIREAGREGLILFEDACNGKTQDRLRAKGFQVVGGSAYGDRLESDRRFGQDTMKRIGLKTAPVFSFDNFDQAIQFIRRRPRRYVYKNNGTRLPSMMNYVGEWEDGTDMIARLQFYRNSQKSPSFILMEHVSGSVRVSGLRDLRCLASRGLGLDPMAFGQRGRGSHTHKARFRSRRCPHRPAFSL